MVVKGSNPGWIKDYSVNGAFEEEKFVPKECNLKISRIRISHYMGLK